MTDSKRFSQKMFDHCCKIANGGGKGIKISKFESARCHIKGCNKESNKITLNDLHGNIYICYSHRQELANELEQTFTTLTSNTKTKTGKGKGKELGQGTKAEESKLNENCLDEVEAIINILRNYDDDKFLKETKRSSKNKFIDSNPNYYTHNIGYLSAIKTSAEAMLVERKLIKQKRKLNENDSKSYLKKNLDEYYESIAELELYKVYKTCDEAIGLLTSVKHLFNGWWDSLVGGVMGVVKAVVGAGASCVKAVGRGVVWAGKQIVDGVAWAGTQVYRGAAWAGRQVYNGAAWVGRQAVRGTTLLYKGCRSIYQTLCGNRRINYDGIDEEIRNLHEQINEETDRLNSDRRELMEHWENLENASNLRAQIRAQELRLVRNNGVNFNVFNLAESQDMLRNQVEQEERERAQRNTNNNQQNQDIRAARAGIQAITQRINNRENDLNQMRQRLDNLQRANDQARRGGWWWVQ